MTSTPSPPPGQPSRGGEAGAGEGMAVGAMTLAMAALPLYSSRMGALPCCRYQVGIPTTLLEIVLDLAIVIGILTFRGRLPWRNPYTWPALVLLLGATVDLLAAPPPVKEAAGIWKAYFMEPALAGLVIAALVRGPAQARWLLGGLAVGGTGAATANIVVVLQALASHTFNLAQPPVAIYNTANAVPLFQVPLDAVALALILYTDRPLDRWLAAVFLVVSAAADILSYSRGGWVALGAALVVVALFHPWRGRITAGTAGLAIVLLAGVGSIRRRVLIELSPTNPDNTVTSRFELWKSALNLLRHRPVVGGGLNGFAQSVTAYRDPGYREDLIYPHNIILNFWSETGLVGLAGFLWLCWRAVGVLRAGLGAGPWARAASIGLLGGLVAIFVHGMVDVPYFKNDLAVEFWALLGLQLGLVLNARVGDGSLA